MAFFLPNPRKAERGGASPTRGRKPQVVTVVCRNGNFIQHSSSNATIGGVRIELPLLEEGEQQTEQVYRLVEGCDRAEPVDIDTISWQTCPHGCLHLRMTYVSNVGLSTGPVRAAFIREVERVAKSLDKSIGTVRVTVRGARELPRTETNKLVDPFVVLRYHTKKVRTAVQLNTVQPVWEQTFQFAVDDLTDDFELECLDWNMYIANYKNPKFNLIGAVGFNLLDLLEGEFSKETYLSIYTITKEKHLRRGGQVRLRVEFTPRSFGGGAADVVERPLAPAHVADDEAEELQAGGGLHRHMYVSVAMNVSRWIGPLAAPEDQYYCTLSFKQDRLAPQIFQTASVLPKVRETLPFLALPLRFCQRLMPLLVVLPQPTLVDAFGVDSTGHGNFVISWGARVANAGTVVLLHPPLALVNVSIGMQRGCQRFDSTGMS